MSEEPKAKSEMPYQGSYFFSKYQIPGFLKVLGPKFQFFLYQIPGSFIQILVIKISKCVKTDVH